ncbi:unnamed protein product [Symbiodinium natans]|uniref:Uncharacterized protein n=1 Tax=Symbiodinium natans TaxID=878477 RepID=A0A812IZ21_9DINO|nr:unnamed protein product [Symbiodinium natans]
MGSGASAPQLGEVKGIPTNAKGETKKKFSAACEVHGKIVMAPYNAKQMCVYDAATEEVTSVQVSEALGDATGTSGKFHSICKADGRVYLAPWSAAQKMLEYDVATGRSTAIDISEAADPTEPKKFSSVCEACGKIYLAPFNAGKMLEYDPCTRTCTGIDVSAAVGSAETSKFYSMCAADGMVYLAPHDAEKMYVYDARAGTGKAVDISAAVDSSMPSKFRDIGAAAGKIYLVPRNAPEMFIYDPSTGSGTGVDVSAAASPGLQGKFRSFCAVGDRIYLAPGCAPQMFVYDAATCRGMAVDISDAAIPSASAKFRAMCVSGGKIYLAPHNAGKMFFYDPVFCMGSGIDISGATDPNQDEKFESMCAFDGRIFLIPAAAEKLVVCKDFVADHRFAPEGARMILDQYQIQLELFQQTWTPRLAAAREVLKQESEKAGISAAYLLEPFLPYVAETAPRGLGFGDAAPSTSFVDISVVMFDRETGLGAKITCPRDHGQGCAGVDAVDQTYRRRATHFVSWCWRYTPQHVIGALRNWCRQSDAKAANVFLWMCFFCNNQYRIAAATSTAQLKTVFESNLSSIGKMIILLDDYLSPVYISRLWCIFETYVSVEQSIEPDVVLPDCAASKLTDELRQEDNVLVMLKNNFQSINVANARATVPSDEEVIKTLINESLGGFEKVNTTVKKRLLPHLTQVVKGFLDSYLLGDE